MFYRCLPDIKLSDFLSHGKEALVTIGEITQRKDTCFNFIRYADDFVIIGENPKLLGEDRREVVSLPDVIRWAHQVKK